MKIEKFLGVIAVVAISIIGVVSPVMADYASEVNADNPTTWYRFEDVYQPASPYVLDEVDGRTGDVDGPERTVGLIGNAMSFDGVDNVITCVDTPDHPSFTVELWAKSAASTWTGGLIYAGSGGSGYLYDLSTGNQIDFHVGIGAVYTGSATGVVTDEWHHYVLTHDDATGATFAYVDGVQVGTATGIVGRTETTVTASIGVDNSSTYFNGLIDEYAVYDSVLSAERVLAHYDAGAVSAAPVPLVKLDFGSEPGALNTVNLGSLGGLQALSGYSGWGEKKTPATPIPTTADSGTSWWSIFGAQPPTAIYGDYQLPELDQVTVALWVNPGHFLGWRNIFASEDTYGDVTLGAWFEGSTLHFTANYTGNVDVENVFTIGEWTHVAVSYDSTSGDAIVYVNGVEKAWAPGCLGWATWIDAGTAGITIGTPPSDAFGFNGFLDNLFIYDIALTQAQVKGLMLTNAAIEMDVPTTCGEVDEAFLYAGDLNKDCHVDLLDFSILAAAWLEPCVNPEDVSCQSPWE